MELHEFIGAFCAENSMELFGDEWDAFTEDQQEGSISILEELINEYEKRRTPEKP